MLDKAKNILFSVVPFSLVWILDQLTKKWIESNAEGVHLGVLKLELVYNHGIFLGWLSHVSHDIKITVLVTLGAIIISSYLLFLVLFPMRSSWLKIGLSIVVGGIIANVTDRLIGEAVIDFISIQSNLFKSPYYNLADIFQWFGYLFIVIGLYQDSKYLWPTQDWRNKFLINQRFQLRVGSFISIFCFIVGFVFIAFSITFLKQLTDNQFIYDYLLISFSLLFFLSACSFIGGVVLSHRIAGPIYALERYVDEVLEGKDKVLKLRKNDEFKELEGISTKIKRIKENFKEN